MKVITQDVKVELAVVESDALRSANAVICKFLDALENANCDTAYFENSALEYEKEDFEYVSRLLDVLGNEDPAIFSA